jgi:hypothetical protein
MIWRFGYEVLGEWLCNAVQPLLESLMDLVDVSTCSIMVILQSFIIVIGLTRMTISLEIC